MALPVSPVAKLLRGKSLEIFGADRCLEMDLIGASFLSGTGMAMRR